MLALLLLDISLIVAVSCFAYKFGKRVGDKKANEEFNEFLNSIPRKTFQSSDNYDYKQYCTGWNECLDTIKTLR